MRSMVPEHSVNPLNGLKEAARMTLLFGGQTHSSLSVFPYVLLRSIVFFFSFLVLSLQDANLNSVEYNGPRGAGSSITLDP